MDRLKTTLEEIHMIRPIKTALLAASAALLIVGGAMAADPAPSPAVAQALADPARHRVVFR